MKRELHPPEEECGKCEVCHVKRRMRFLNGEVVEVDGRKVVGYLDLGIVEGEGGRHEMFVGLTKGTSVNDLLMAIGALAQAVEQIIDGQQEYHH